MRPTYSSRWRRSGAATAALLALLGASGCSGTSHNGAPSPAASHAQSAAARAALTKALAASKALRSYAFRASQSLTGGSHPQVTVLVGRAVRPRELAYTLTVDATVQSVVKLGPTVFVKLGKAPWKALAKPTPTVDPLASLLALLAGAENAVLTGHVLTADVPAGALGAARLAPSNATPGTAAPVRFVLDAAGRVTSVSLTLSVRHGAETLTVEDVTTFGAFDRVPPVKAPGVVKKK